MLYRIFYIYCFLFLFPSILFAKKDMPSNNVTAQERKTAEDVVDDAIAIDTLNDDAAPPSGTPIETIQGDDIFETDNDGTNGEALSKLLDKVTKDVETDDVLPPASYTTVNTAILQGIDKITGRFFTLSAPLGHVVQFGTLRLKVHYCHRTPPEKRPESTAFIEIWEYKQETEPQRLFSTWMFGSSPAVSTLEHPVYSVWLKECTMEGNIEKNK